jgi:outer membrane protein
VALRHSNVRLITQKLRAAKDRFEVGEVTRTDVALAEAQGLLVRAQEEYSAAVGHKPRSLAPPPRVPKTAASPSAAKAVALRRHPDMKKIQHSVTAAELNVLLAEAAMNPTVNLSAGL